MNLKFSIVILFFVFHSCAFNNSSRSLEWERHIIDNSSSGADGVRLADVNRDGLMDIATGWEEGGFTKIYIHPGYANVTSKWPFVKVGETPSVEDVVFCDLDDDGSMDVISSTEGQNKEFISIGHLRTSTIIMTRCCGILKYSRPLMD